MKCYLLSALAFIGLLTAAQAQPAAAAPTNAAVAAPFEWGPGIKVLIMGGGYAHDYQTFDNKADTAILNAVGITSIHYTEDDAVAARELPHADVMLFSSNARFDTPPFVQAVSNFANAGKGVVLLHSGSFYAGKWLQFYTTLAGGGAHDHDGTSQFDETVIKDHPVVHGLPTTFKITDELYHIVPEQGASPMEVLVEASRPGGEKYPSVWIVHYGKSRIVSIALGHDGAPRSTPEFPKLLANAVKWAGGQ